MKLGLCPVPAMGGGRAEPGVWDALLHTLVDLGLTDDWQDMTDNTNVRRHVAAAGGKGGCSERFLIGVSAGRLER